MARAGPSTRPIQTLYDAIRSLEAATLVCLASPKKKPVHQLRTWTRRIEAQLELIALLPHSGSNHSQASAPNAKARAKALRLLRKIRREAGRVRDLDVQLDLIARESARAKGSSQAAKAIRKEARALRRDIERRRGEEADTLIALLKKKHKRLPLLLKDLSDALAPMKETALTEEKLITLVRDWYVRCNPHQSSGSDQNSNALHAIRKRAKLARYMAESAGDSAARARHLARRFEDIQQAGGRWHDWLQLCRLTRKELGKSAQLSPRFAAHAARSLTTYKRKLAAASR